MYVRKSICKDYQGTCCLASNRIFFILLFYGLNPRFLPSEPWNIHTVTFKARIDEQGPQILKMNSTFSWMEAIYCDTTFITWQRKSFHFATSSWKTFWRLAFCSLCFMLLVTTSIFQESFSLAQNIKERVHWGGKWRCKVGSEKKVNVVIQFETCLEVHIIRYMPISISILLHFLFNSPSLLASGGKYWK